jgi:hypothetical protein
MHHDVIPMTMNSLSRYTDKPDLAHAKFNYAGIPSLQHRRQYNSFFQMLEVQADTWRNLTAGVALVTQ